MTHPPELAAEQATRELIAQALTFVKTAQAVCANTWRALDRADTMATRLDPADSTELAELRHARDSFDQLRQAMGDAARHADRGLQAGSDRPAPQPAAAGGPPAGQAL